MNLLDIDKHLSMSTTRVPTYGFNHNHLNRIALNHISSGACQPSIPLRDRRKVSSEAQNLDFHFSKNQNVPFILANPNLNVLNIKGYNRAVIIPLML